MQSPISASSNHHRRVALSIEMRLAFVAPPFYSCDAHRTNADEVEAMHAMRRIGPMIV
jgi:hypothetical protein